MSRHGVTYKVGGAIARPLDLTIKMQRSAPAPDVVPCAICTPNPIGVFWFNEVTGKFDLSIVTGNVDQYYIPDPPFFYAARVEGELCGRDSDIVISSDWNPDFTEYRDPSVFTAGNILIVYSAIDYQQLMACSTGTLTVTAKLDGKQIGVITLNIIQPPPS